VKRGIRSAEHGWANWWIDRGRLSLWYSKRDLRMISWRRA
jgi:hypothetical protein